MTELGKSSCSNLSSKPCCLHRLTLNTGPPHPRIAIHLSHSGTFLCHISPLFPFFCFGQEPGPENVHSMPACVSDFLDFNTVLPMQVPSPLISPFPLPPFCVLASPISMQALRMHGLFVFNIFLCPALITVPGPGYCCC